MRKLLRLLKKLPELLNEIFTFNKQNYKSFNLYFQDESRFGLKTHIGKCLTARGVKPIVKYQHAFKNTPVFVAGSPKIRNQINQLGFFAHHLT